MNKLLSSNKSLTGRRFNIAIARSVSVSASACKAGAGLGNVQDRMLPSTMAPPGQPLFRHIRDPMTVSVIGAPMTHGQPYVGADAAPSILREKGLLSNLTKLGWRVEDMQDLNFQGMLENCESINHHPNAKNSFVVGRGCQMLANLVEEKAVADKFPLILGGDHSVALGSLAGILRARPRTGVLWIDAHADINTPEISESGNMHGMPLGLLIEEMGADHATIPGCEWLVDGPRLRPDSIVYIGLRDVDAAERAAIRMLGIVAFTMYDVDKYGIGEVMDMAMSHLLKEDEDRPLHLSYDIDAVDPALAPATGTAVRGGLTFREAHYVAEATAASGLLASCDLVELNPTLADGKAASETTDLGMHLLTSLMGRSII